MLYHLQDLAKCAKAGPLEDAMCGAASRATDPSAMRR